MTGAAPDPARLLAIAAGAARTAARLLAARAPDDHPTVVLTKSSPTDVVTEMDQRAEALITEYIRAARPADAILGEEGGETPGTAAGGTAAGAGGGPPGAEPAAVRWIVDPLDGTVNYLYGLSDWAVSIAAEVAGTVVAGVVDAPRRGEVFTATAGGGAWLRRVAADRQRSPAPPGAAPVQAAVADPADTAPMGTAGAQRLRCTRGVPLGQALVATGFGYAAGRRRVQGEVVGALLPQVRDIRRGGSASVDLCLVAAGRLDAFYERGLNYWDYAAGALIAQEAGARVAGLAGRPAGPAMTIAADPGLYAQLSDALARLDPERDG